MENLRSHKAVGVEAAIEAVGASVWWLPPYSPDLNPIEKLWSKIKSWLRPPRRTLSPPWPTQPDMLSTLSPHSNASTTSSPAGMEYDCARGSNLPLSQILIICALDLCTQCGEAVLHVLVAAIEVIDAADDGAAMRRHSRQDKGS